MRWLLAVTVIAACGSSPPSSTQPISNSSQSTGTPTPECVDLWDHLETIDIAREPFTFGADDNAPPDPARERRKHAREAGKTSWLEQCRTFSKELVQCGMDANGPSDADACDPRFALSGK